MNHNHHRLHIINAEKSSLLSYWPLVLIYSISFGLSFLSVKYHPTPDFMSHFMGFVLVFFGLIKLNDVQGFAEGFAKYDPIAKRFSLYGKMYPYVEVALGVLFILQLLALPSILITLIIYGASLYGTVKSLLNKEELHCVCLGTYFRLPLSRVTIIESVFMIGMSVWMLIMLNQMTGMSM